MSKLQVDWSWRNFHALVTDVDHPTAPPLYQVKWHALTKPHLVFTRPETGEVFGTGTLHAVRIHADYTVAGRTGTLHAQKRLQTLYTHQSYAYADADADASLDSSTNRPPVTMTWTSDSNFTRWDFVCSDERLRPVARYSARLWGVKKIGVVEFMDDRELSEQQREEIVVVGMTLAYCMLLRVNNVFNLLGAALPKKKPEDSGSS
ncbi:hypothetical protein BJX61DRAFT_498301 [Aspergillus egyptiacus]|nr:hypothetical protein BJX61DRAFT_498301 [Aspergillus egyptiacus]